MHLSKEELDIRQRLKTDFPHYTKTCLKIRPKSGNLIPFELNKAQLYIHQKIEQQKKELGYVRAIILKGRQQGVSTYIGARFFHLTTHAFGIKTFILTHQDKSTKELFQMTKRFYDHCPEQVKPAYSANNSNELFFDKLDSSYKTGTAKSKGEGRGSTIQLFHGSEVAFWQHAEDHLTGIMQAIPNEDGTEVILESTANGENNYFHAAWQAATRGESKFIAIFIPWFWQPEYRTKAPEGFTLTEEESLLARVHGLDESQLAWRREKIAELKGDATLFKQEYPCTPDEAFQTTGRDIFISSEAILKARAFSSPSTYGPLLIGVDPARFGEDSTGIARRQGRKAYGFERHQGMDVMQVAGLVANIIDKEKPYKVFIDTVGLGAGVYDRLKELGFGLTIISVNFGESSSRKAYFNKRAEAWGEMKEWLLDEQVDIPDDNELHAQLRAPCFSYTSSQQIKLESKDDMRKRGVKSPDLADALALTFSYPVAWKDPELKKYAPSTSSYMHGGNAWGAL